MNIDDFTDRYDRYLDAVNEPDPPRRAELLAAAGADDLSIVSPAYEVFGRDRVADKLGELMASIDPPVRMRRSGAADGHHARYRVRWEATTGGTVVVRGQHFVETDGQLLRRITVFLDANEVAETEDAGTNDTTTSPTIKEER